MTNKNSNQQPKSRYSHILIMTAVAAERDAIVRGLSGDTRFDVELAGVGPAAAAANTARALANNDYDLVISAGIAGGFIGRTTIGSIAISSSIISADLGAESPDGFISVDELGFGSSTIPVKQDLITPLYEKFKNANLPVGIGTILTLSTVTGTETTAKHLEECYPNALAEAMEGFGVATTAQLYQLPVLEIRTISNPIGPRDRSAWKIKEALISLEKASTYLREVY